MLSAMIILVIIVPLIVVIPISIIGTHYQNQQHKKQSKQKCPIPLRCQRNRWMLMKSSIDELLDKRN